MTPRHDIVAIDDGKWIVHKDTDSHGYQVFFEYPKTIELWQVQPDMQFIRRWRKSQIASYINEQNEVDTF